MMYLTRYVELLERQLQTGEDLPAWNRQPGEYVPTLRRPRQAAAHGPEQGG